MKKALRKLLPSIVMVLLAVSMVGTSTYAWFSMNRTVAVTGMTVDTTVTDSLSIAALNAEENYDSSLAQSRSGHLRPVSTVDGVNFFYTEGNNVKGNGDAKSNAYIAYSEAEVGTPDPTNALANTDAGKTHYDAQFQTKYAMTDPVTTGNVLYGYIDYVFYIKATNVTGSAEDLKLTSLNLLYNGAVVTEKAWRVAVFAQAAEKDTALNTAPAAGDRKAMLTLSGAANFEGGKAVNSTTTTDTVTYTSAAWAVDSIAAGATEYNKVTVRLWLEGEDSTCNNDTFATLTESYSLSLNFVLGGDETAVLTIGSVAA